MVAVLAVAIVAALEAVQVVLDAWLVMDIAIVVRLVTDATIWLAAGLVMIAKVAKIVIKLV